MKGHTNLSIKDEYVLDLIQDYVLGIAEPSTSFETRKR